MVREAVMIEPMLLKGCKDKNLQKYEGEYIAQQKYDGTRIIATRKDNIISLQTRSGKNDLALEYPEIVKELLSLRATQFVLDGELVFFRKDTGKAEFLTGLAVETRQDYTFKLMLFDVLEWNNNNIRNEKTNYRSFMVKKLVTDSAYTYLDYIRSYEENFDKLYNDVVNNGGEGLVLKKIDSDYRDGKRTSNWLKVKRVETHDVFIIGLMKGEGKYEHQFGSLIIGQYTPTGKVMVVGATSGLTDDMRTLLYDSVSKEPRFDTYTSTKGEEGHILHKVAPKIVIEVECMERFPDTGMMRHPRFIRIREDKTPKECIYDNSR